MLSEPSIAIFRDECGQSKKEPQHVATAALASVWWGVVGRPDSCLSSGLYYGYALRGALRNHDIAAGRRDRCGEARPTQTQWVADAGGATEQIIAHYRSNNANEATSSRSTSST